jgi:hypothetical protein
MHHVVSRPSPVGEAFFAGYGTGGAVVLRSDPKLARIFSTSLYARATAEYLSEIFGEPFLARPLQSEELR